jgi:hypothetical protein
MAKGREEKRGERKAFLSLLFATEKPTVNACWGKRWGTSLFVFKLTLGNLHFFSDSGIFFVEWRSRIVKKLHMKYKNKAVQ